jgi:acetylglutamate kinase
MNLDARCRPRTHSNRGARRAAVPPPLSVLKLGGEVLENARQLRALVRSVACARRHAPLVIVHGGGAQVTRVAGHLGLRADFRQGVRVTDRPIADVAEMVLSGFVNKMLVAALVRQNVAAIGLSGKDLGLVEAVPVDGLGRVGVPRRVRADCLWDLLALGYTPVLASIAADNRGETLNINADHLAASVAGGLGAKHLLFVSSSGGVRQDPGNRRSALLSTLSTLEAEARIALGALTHGMIPKVRAARRALELGVERVGILSPGSATGIAQALRRGQGIGTWIVEAGGTSSRGRPASSPVVPKDALAARLERSKRKKED